MTSSISAIPTPDEARDLRAIFTANPIMAQAEAALRTWPIHTARQAAELLPGWKYVGQLTERERSAVLGRFICVERLGDESEQRTCGEPVYAQVIWSDLGEDGRWSPSTELRVCVGCAARLRAEHPGCIRKPIATWTARS